MAGVRKSAVVSCSGKDERSENVREKSTVKTLDSRDRSFFSREHTRRRTTGYPFATLAYQLATNFSSVRDDVNSAICENPALLDPDKSLHDQMEALFIQPLRKLRFRLRDCPPPVFAVDALDECTSETGVTDPISLLGRALCEPDVPMVHILLRISKKPFRKGYTLKCARYQ
ncbi:hypothetical protein K503DRAFT_538037 [Rhizopogon vinicolor AM-OR11-026]|uniref:Nephrocystin 3-like N-terminal domain-containing protein n=1 Tax=Rhizopogon vinicolor AM-OR11-026 TaxID=1314800 RepID=A0A1B7MKU0_9AGAM|nr:hypothetical protein K503DRAFT_538037 [Rhizopogon vinicolor AM-OR11-026]